VPFAQLQDAMHQVLERRTMERPVIDAALVAASDR
jgi:hypothetical protein